MKLNPTKDNIVLKKLDEAQTTSSGIILTTQQNSNTSAYLVVAVGEDVTGLSTGDKVLTHTHTGYDISFEGEKYKFVKQVDILAVIIS